MVCRALINQDFTDAYPTKELRQNLLSLKPNNRNNWIALIIANHLTKDYGFSPLSTLVVFLRINWAIYQSEDSALQILEKFEAATGQNHEPYEHGELLLFKNLIMEEVS